LLCCSAGSMFERRMLVAIACSPRCMFRFRGRVYSNTYKQRGTGLFVFGSRLRVCMHPRIAALNQCAPESNASAKTQDIRHAIVVYGSKCVTLMYTTKRAET